jgi:hypothetical protein
VGEALAPRETWPNMLDAGVDSPNG